MDLSPFPDEEGGPQDAIDDLRMIASLLEQEVEEGRQLAEEFQDD